MRQDPQFVHQPIAVDPIAGKTYLSTSDLNFNFDPGMRATAGMRLCGDRALEFTYFGIFDGTASAVVAKPGGGLDFPIPSSRNAFHDMDRVQTDYSSWMHSFEVNLPCCCGCCEECGCAEAGEECGCDQHRGECGRGEVRCRSFEWFAGFRYLDLGEDFDISTQRTVSGGVEDGAYNIRTTNQLFGAQLGARVRRTWGRFGWEATSKAGIFGNAARENQTVTDFPGYVFRTVSSSRGGVAFVGEANLSALYRLTDVWNLRAGYTVMSISGLALAPDQLDFAFSAPPSGMSSNGSMFLHGANLGLEARW